MVILPAVGVAQTQGEGELPTPSRIGMVSGAASFWRPGAENWSPAQVNTPLAVGDALYTAEGATLELQVGPSAYVRMAQNAMLTLLADEPGRRQIKISSGIVAFDVRGLSSRNEIEIDTPAGVFNIDSAGYYRVDVADEDAHFIVRRGGEATITLADGTRRLIAPSQEAVVESGDDGNSVATYVAPEPDAWDRWNYARTDDLMDAISSRYVSPDVYGVDDLDHYGDWRVTAEYGPAWFPSGMPADWAPYSSGSWVWDPVYSWTWIDTAPWGWAPYHYGRWVSVNGYWCWTPGPRHYHSVYAPALVAFFESGHNVMQPGAGGSAISWVALSWGEPVRPWWGRRDFIGKPWWGGWSGPRIVNNVVIRNTATVNNITNITYRNFGQRNALIAMPEKNFGHGRLAAMTHIDPGHARELKPIVGQHPVRPVAGSLAPVIANTAIPAPGIVNRPAVVLHPPQRIDSWRSEHPESQPGLPARQAVPESKVITVRPQRGREPSWAEFGKAAGPERGEPRRPADPPKIDAWGPRAPVREQPGQQNAARVEQQRIQGAAQMPSPPAQHLQDRDSPVRPVGPKQGIPPPNPAVQQRESHVAPLPDKPRQPEAQVMKREQPRMESQGAGIPPGLPGRAANQMYPRPEMGGAQRNQPTEQKHRGQP